MERLLKKGYEVIYLTEPVDEYCIQALPEFDGKRFQNVAKEGIKFDESEKAKEKRESLEKEFEPLTTWLKDQALKDKVKQEERLCQFSRCVLAVRRASSNPTCCLTDREGRRLPETDPVTLRSGGQSVRLVRKHGEDHEGSGLPDGQRHLHKVSSKILRDFPANAEHDFDLFSDDCVCCSYYASQKKTLEINPKHPLVKKMLELVNVCLLAAALIFITFLHSFWLISRLTGFSAGWRRGQDGLGHGGASV